MAFLELTRSAKILDLQTTVRVILPDIIEPKKELPVIWLFHGLGDNGSAWARKTNLEQLVSTKDWVIIMPDMGRSFYSDMTYGGKYWQYLTCELIPQMQNLLPISQNPADNYVVGNSMGGYGALKLAFSYPEKFRAVAAISPVVDLKVVPTIMSDYQGVFGENGVFDSQNELLAIAKQAPVKDLATIKLFQIIGDEDFLKEDNDRFHTEMASVPIETDYQVLPGNHDWIFWNEAIKKVLDWLNHI
ncbi:alpha/beta hydrolase [Enterococcus sp. 2201sp1_2201st1_B8_2201SCRN_220225]|uniref:alpha/beta hydrolase n=1 Tax=unclassified Enterococcus TaxID=2608891 RepID=UPI0034A52966